MLLRTLAQRCLPHYKRQHHIRSERSAIDFECAHARSRAQPRRRQIIAIKKIHATPSSRHKSRNPHHTHASPQWSNAISPRIFSSYSYFRVRTCVFTRVAPCNARALLALSFPLGLASGPQPTINLVCLRDKTEFAPQRHTAAVDKCTNRIENRECMRASVRKTQ